MPTREYFLEQIEKEFSAARSALAVGNDGKARVCARRAAGQALSWYMTAIPRSWGTDAMRQLLGAKDEPSFPAEVREAAARLSTRISEKFTYAFATNPLDDASLIVRHVRSLMEKGGATDVASD